MDVRIRHGKGKKIEAFARFHRIVTDQPFEEGGMEAGMTPPELMLASLGCCAMHYAAEYLRARGLPPDNLEVRVWAEKGGKPVRLAEMGIEVDAPGLTSRTREGLLKAVESCLLHRTLEYPPMVHLRLAAELAEGQAVS